MTARSDVHVDHVSIAVPSIDEALKFFTCHFPIKMHWAKTQGYTPDFNWCDFHIGAFKLELIEPLGTGGFVEKFIAKRGPGMHHWSLHTGNLDPLIAPMEAGGVRIVDRFDAGNGDKTAFLSPRSVFGVLVQFWQVSEVDEHPPSGPVPFRLSSGATIHMEVDHVSIAVHDIDATLRFFERYFPFELRRAPHKGWDGTFDVASFYVNGYKVELIQNRAGKTGFVTRFLEKRGEGLHHIAIDVDDLDAYVKDLENGGVRVVDHQDLGRGYRTAFISPRSAFGVLIQLWQEPRS